MLVKIDNAPQNGICLIYYRSKEIEYSKYSSNDFDSLKERILNEINDILELHFFDESTEYRAIHSRVKNGFIETIINDSVSSNLIMSETILLDDKFKNEDGNDCIEVINYISYDNKGMAMIDNYRLKEVK